MARVLPLAVAVYLHSVASAFAINIVGNAPINPWAWALVCGFIVGLLGLVAWMIARDARQKRPVRARSGEEVMVDFLMGHTRRGWTRNETVLPDVQIVHGPEHGTASVRPITNGILAGRLGIYYRSEPRFAGSDRLSYRYRPFPDVEAATVETHIVVRRPKAPVPPGGPWCRAANSRLRVL
jgi:hypothetical protein